MKDYRSAMDHCAPDLKMEARLKEKVLAAGPGESACRVYRPRSFGRKLLLAAAVAAALTASVGAALTQVPWDKIFAERFGEEAAATETAAQAFQEVNVTSVCDDVTLTVRQAVGDDKTIYMILDMQLPPDVDADAVQRMLAAPSVFDWMETPRVSYYATDDVSWADIRDLTYEEAERVLDGSRFPGGGSSGISEVRFDPDTRTMTYLLYFTRDVDGETDLTARALTLLVGSPVLHYGDMTEVPLTGHPAILTFQPDYVQRSRTYELRDGDGTLKYTVSLSPFALSAKSYFGGYTSIREFAEDVTLVYQDGTEGLPARDLGWGGGGSRPTDSETFTTLSFSLRFHDILDVGTVKAIRAGDCEIAIEDWTE
jgi:hypothetical protein